MLEQKANTMISLTKATIVFLRSVILFLSVAATAISPCLGQGNESTESTMLRTNASEKTLDAASPSDAELLKELEAMKARIEMIEKQLQERSPHSSSVVPATANNSVASTATQKVATANSVAVATGPAEDLQNSEKPSIAEPFAFADWTWLNGTPRNKDTVWDSKFFTPEIRFDSNFVHSFNRPKDDTIGGSTEVFRSNEFQLDQVSVGGDFHWQNVRARLLTMQGMFAVTTPRNDASVGRGQWDLRGAYRYFSEAWGGYHFNVNHGLNVDAGIFVSYIGLFSYYNFDNWAYQPSYVSSNTPWFFNGLRIQWFPTDKLKIEPWIINGWQSYGRFGSKPGLGGQILYRPRPWLSLVFNNYGMGEDTLGNPSGLNGLGRSRIHTDDSVQVKYYDNPNRLLDKMAFSVTGDLGCEYGAGVACHGNVKDGSGKIVAYKQDFIGWMAYNRFWFVKDLYGITIGGGAMNNPGRYLVLLPPINGADSVSGSPYFTQNPGDAYKAWDTSLTFDYMPREYITFRSEYGYRHASVPYFTGPNGITPPGGNTGTPSALVILPNGSVWQPDLRKDEASVRFAIMVKF